ncbi:MAG: ABC transporter permease [Bacteroidetes bacterium]|nr:ABC transporter permease [Bacteroidota bacterium]
MASNDSVTYSQSRALLAIIKASFQAILANPSALVFSIAFPILFVIIFGAFRQDKGMQYAVAIQDGSDTTHAFYQALIKNPFVKIVRFSDSVSLRQALLRGKVTGVLAIESYLSANASPAIKIRFTSTTASGNTTGGFLQQLDYLILQQEATQANRIRSIQLLPPTIEEVRPYRPIDFVLPGQIGFSILFSTLFGIAFTFYGLREQLVLKRFFATPIRPINVLIGIGISRLFFQLVSVSVLIAFGHWVMDFTLHNGLTTFLSILLLTILMLFLLMGVGLLISSVAKVDSSIPLLINLFALPQLILSGTFFPVDVFPRWIQQISALLPLRHFNDALRKISFEGESLLACGTELGVLLGWTFLIYFLTSRLIRWE